jgi:hypothetical protein
VAKAPGTLAAVACGCTLTRRPRAAPRRVQAPQADHGRPTHPDILCVTLRPGGLWRTVQHCCLQHAGARALLHGTGAAYVLAAAPAAVQPACGQLGGSQVQIAEVPHRQGLFSTHPPAATRELLVGLEHMPCVRAPNLRPPSCPRWTPSRGDGSRLQCSRCSTQTAASVTGRATQRVRQAASLCESVCVCVREEAALT